MGKISPERQAELDRATARAIEVIKPGDWIGRTVCMGIKTRFKFTHWENGCWLYGRTVSDCHAIHIYSVNGVPASFADREAL